MSGLSLAIAPGELVSFLGPSGCGKTTTLRIIAGFVDPDSGRVLMKQTDITDLPPNKRDIGMLFQSYALFPHLTAADNVAFGLRMRHVPRRERRQRVDEALDLVQLRDLVDRFPHQMSGGQQQRVALARAIVIRPRVLLLDEPLSNLDAKLRRDMRAEIRQLQRQLGITTIFVTHDQEEALTISDRIVVMNRGRVEQIGQPSEIYRFPRTLFVARFIGEANILSGSVEASQTGQVRFLIGAGAVLAGTPDAELAPGAAAVATVRPENLRVFRPDDPRSDRYANRFAGIVEATTYLGAATAVRVRIDPAISLQVMQQSSEADADQPDHAPRSGEAVTIAWHADSCRIIRAA